jgi:hypothetical protein
VSESLIHINFDKLYLEAGVVNFNDDLRPLLEDIIKDIYASHGELVLQLRLIHIDRAIFKFRQAQEKKQITNTKKYFKACLVSAIMESGLEQLAFSDMDD